MQHVYTLYTAVEAAEIILNELQNTECKNEEIEMDIIILFPEKTNGLTE